MASDTSSGIPILRSSREPGHRQTTWPELLNDLVFTAIIAQLAQRLLTDDSDMSFLEFVLLFVPIWWLWNGETTYSTRFDNERDVTHRVLTSIQLIALIILATTIPRSVESEALSTVFAITYSITRFALLVEYGRVWYYLPETRDYIRRIVLGFSVSIILWVASVFVPIPYRYWLWALGLLIELTTPLVAIGAEHHKKFPPDVRHLPERYGLFTLLVLGQSITSIVNAMIDHGLTMRSVSATILCSIIVIGIWWAYFDRVDDEAVRKVEKDGSNLPYRFWLYLHLPLTMALTMVGVGMEMTVRNVDTLDLSRSAQWFITGALSGYFLTQACISLTTLLSGPCHPSFRRGIIVRFGLAVAFALLGFLENIGPLQLLSILVASVLGLILSDTLGPEPPSNFEGGKEKENQP
ncbi:low temperature requirement protein A [Spirosoma rhododendri]|uniref:Low temperature requirement protein A n=1 Tax=Spirosoma rhododendri TaxID=2728024 RepID=A0A7L5DKI0_9BACT|nr:low temperature requirement protein A [Spirosoma rhododendri]QJD78959.1 low temperature requirement protein A [Spirosoma rhododendri]